MLLVPTESFCIRNEAGIGTAVVAVVCLEPEHIKISSIVER